MLLAERELASGRLCGRWRGYARMSPIPATARVPAGEAIFEVDVVFVDWLAKELKMNVDCALIDAETILKVVELIYWLRVARRVWS